MTPNVCYVVAARDEAGEYIPENEVFVEISDAIEAAAAFSAEDPTCDPRIVQVILDPMHPSLAAKRIAAEIMDEIEVTQLVAPEILADGEDVDGYLNGLTKALEIAQEEGVVVDLDDLDQGGKET